MTKSGRAPWLVQRRVIDGDVIVVRPPAQRQVEGTAQVSEARNMHGAGRLTAAGQVGEAGQVREEQAEPDAGVAASASPWSQPNIPVPPGYAYEFGTWRLVPED